MMRWTTCLLIALLPACRPAAVPEGPGPGVAPTIEVEALWPGPDGERRVGGVFCQLFEPEAAEPARWGVTDGEAPLRFADLQPGPYRLVVLGRDGLERGRPLELPPRRRLEVRVVVEGDLRPRDTTRGEALTRRAAYVCQGEPADGAESSARAVRVLDPSALVFSTQARAN